MKVAALILSMSITLTQIVYASPKALVEVVKCESEDFNHTLAVFILVTDSMGDKDEPTVGTIEISKGLFGMGRMLWEQIPMEIKNQEELLKINLPEMRGAKSILTIDMKDETGILTDAENGEEVGKFKCTPPQGA